MNSVERGRWKLVSSAPAVRTRTPGTMKVRAFAREGPHPPALVGGGFEQAQRGRAHADDAPGGVDALGRLRRDLAALGMDAMLLDPLGAHGQERARADVQRHGDARDAGGVEGGEQAGREVQPGSRRGDGALVAAANMVW